MVAFDRNVAYGAIFYSICSLRNTTFHSMNDTFYVSICMVAFDTNVEYCAM
jgi:hypothetical protein